MVDRDHTVFDWQHYLPLIERKPGALRNGAPFEDLPAALQTLRRALLRRRHGQGARSRCWSGGNRSGGGRAGAAGRAPEREHVLNVLARLLKVGPPPSVETDLVVSEPPTTDTTRYDRLRTEVAHG